MKIRRLNPLDAIAYQAIRLKALQNNPEAFGSSYEEEKDQPVEKYILRFQSSDSITLGAFVDDELVGVVTIFRESLVKLQHRATIIAMYVAPDQRELGLGKSLMAEVIQVANDWAGVEQVYLTVVMTNEPAKKLYASLGFEVFGTEKKALKVGDTYFDEEHMVLFL
ncbi:GNAT family N-acetyltransferase [Sporosarcina sp. YIM B06819]|uniref:GNAT family N-acetyltransferase n=1 Tax=Sporosarcina sp. YIM B06819 TaxID=3081769 RepID=UPI00298C39C7|nr:GNAT family N-acetyltransferase [Sporosarcina sp. YIM B06819]